jgi:hypothetical protein
LLRQALAIVEKPHDAFVYIDRNYKYRGKENTLPKLLQEPHFFLAIFGGLHLGQPLGISEGGRGNFPTPRVLSQSFK